MKIALLGAESTGKTALAQSLAEALAQRSERVAVVPEWLRLWCDRQGRTPRPDEQTAIAGAQAEQADQAARALGPNGIVIADTTPLMTAIYSDKLFGDRSLYPFALAHQRSYDLTLLMGLDLPWVADGLQRDGPHVRTPVDTLLREVLTAAGLPYRVVYGTGERRLAAALAAMAGAGDGDGGREPGAASLEHCCERCGSGACEHALFTQLVGQRRVSGGCAR